MATWGIRDLRNGGNGWLQEPGGTERWLAFTCEEDAHRFLSRLNQRGYRGCNRLMVSTYPGRLPGGRAHLVKSGQESAVADYLADIGGSTPGPRGD